MKTLLQINILAIALLCFMSSCDKDNSTPNGGTNGGGNNPTNITTAPVTNITATSAKSGGLISGIPDSTIIQRGVCWSTNTNPTISNAKTVDGQGDGQFQSSISGLTPSTAYFVRAYAIISSDVIYGNQITFSTNAGSGDVIPPTITLVGDDFITIELQEPYIELGAIASDNLDPNITVQITGNVNNNLKGEYIITYTATDQEGNSASVERIVEVINSADILVGNYSNAYESCNSSGSFFFNATVVSSNTQNGKFSIQNFGGFGANTYVELTINSQDGIISGVGGQTLGGGAILGNIFSGQLNGLNPITFNIDYSWIDPLGQTDYCSSYYIKQ